MSVKGSKSRKNASKDRPKVMSLVSVPKDKLSSSRERSGNMPDLNGWKRVGDYSSYAIYAKGELRRLINTTTEQLIIEYLIPRRNSNAINYV